MRIRSALAALALLAATTVASQEAMRLPCAPDDKPCLIREIQRHPARNWEGWRGERGRPLAERFGPAPQRVVEYLHLDNVLNGFAERPRPARVDPGFAADLRAALASLPPQIARLFEQRLAGIYLVDHLGGTGYTEAIVDTAGRPMGGFIVLDAAVLGQRTANEWATWKENTPFQTDSAWRLVAQIEDPQDNTRANAIAYILLHELGHVLAVGRDLHPPWELGPREIAPWQRFPFFELSWTMDRAANRYVSLFERELPRRRDIAYYLGPRLPATEMLPTYAGLELTNFPTLYSATSPGDDFAESFATYVHVVLQGKPWLVTVSRDGEIVRTLRTCWSEPRCAVKRKLLEQVISQP